MIDVGAEHEVNVSSATRDDILKAVVEQQQSPLASDTFRMKNPMHTVSPANKALSPDVFSAATREICGMLDDNRLMKKFEHNVSQNISAAQARWRGA